MIANLISVVFMKKKMPLVNVIAAWMRLGTPFCVTVDQQTKEDNTVTIRYRDSMEQDRVAIDKVKEIVLKAINLIRLLSIAFSSPE